MCIQPTNATCFLLLFSQFGFRCLTTPTNHCSWSHGEFWLFFLCSNHWWWEVIYLLRSAQTCLWGRWFQHWSGVFHWCIRSFTSLSRLELVSCGLAYHCALSLQTWANVASIDLGCGSSSYLPSNGPWNLLLLLFSSRCCFFSCLLLFQLVSYAEGICESELLRLLSSSCNIGCLLVVTWSYLRCLCDVSCKHCLPVLKSSWPRFVFLSWQWSILIFTSQIFLPSLILCVCPKHLFSHGYFFIFIIQQLFIQLLDPC